MFCTEINMLCMCNVLMIVCEEVTGTHYYTVKLRVRESFPLQQYWAPIMLDPTLKLYMIKSHRPLLTKKH